MLCELGLTAFAREGTISAAVPQRQLSLGRGAELAYEALWKRLMMRFALSIKLARRSYESEIIKTRIEIRLVWSSLCPRWSGYHSKRRPGLCHQPPKRKKTPITVRAGSDRITISRSPRRGLTKLAIDGAQHSHDEVRSENHTHKRAPDAGAKAQLERMMAPEARTTLTR
ncbi:unnamed protein product [Trichogramma brassicae]|uniref:Uncharacterized protein n=1 Tax=Trichogramma brassicae TaxID=86971 RepID=A0A6H5HZT7_9HYME|nr:unnamed protein product [Trichogramma brassicae]